MGSGDGSCGLTPPDTVGNTGPFCVQPAAGGMCRNDSQCDSSDGAGDGQCSRTLPHAGVCNGRFIPTIGSGDTGPGSVTFAPIGSLVGLPVTLNLESNFPCGNEGPGQPLSFALTSTSASAIIDHVNNSAGTLNFALSQATTATPKTYELQNFSCDQWTDPAGPGCLGLVAPVLDQNLGANFSDLVTAFKLCGR